MNIIVNKWDKYWYCTILQELPSKKAHWKNIRIVECLCSCWKIFISRLNNLRTGSTKSCWCFQKKQTSNKTLKHWLSGHRLYNTWYNMMNRCYSPYCKAYKNYWWRGIEVCSSRKKLKNFIHDMSETYKEWLTLERIDVNGNYCIENCSWVTPQQQHENRRNTILVSWVSLKSYCKSNNINYNNAYYFLKQWKDIEYIRNLTNTDLAITYKQMQKIITMINQLKTIFKNKYWKMHKAQRATVIYNYFCELQNKWMNTPIKRIATLTQFISDNQEYLW